MGSIELAATYHGVVRSTKPGAATDNRKLVAAADAAAVVCRPFRAGRKGTLDSWG